MPDWEDATFSNKVVFLHEIKSAGRRMYKRDADILHLKPCIIGLAKITIQVRNQYLFEQITHRAENLK